MKKIGIMGGTFDPIHNGHLILAEHGRLKFNLDQILFIPTGNPPHKDRNNISSSRYRYDMVSLAINTNPYFEISSMEMENQEITYTIDTIKRLKEENPEGDFHFIIGSDSFYQIHTWKDYKELVTLCRFIVVKRPDGKDGKLEKDLYEFNRKFNGLLHILDAPLIDISSTDIRQRVASNLSIKYLVPESVEKYIENIGLYKG